LNFDLIYLSKPHGGETFYSFCKLVTHALRGSFVYVFHDLAFYTSCIFLSFDHEYFCVGDTFIHVLYMVDVFCEVFQESFCQFVTKIGRKLDQQQPFIMYILHFGCLWIMLGFVTKLPKGAFVSIFVGLIRFQNAKANVYGLKH
jgi:hypothetical protein